MFERPAMLPVQDVLHTDASSELATSRSSSSEPLTPGSLSESTCSATKSASATQRASGISKSEKEKRQRNDHARHFQNLEDWFVLVGGIRPWDNKVQSGNNGATSGLTLVKEQIFQIAETLLGHFLTEKYAEAVRNGNVVQSQGYLRELVERVHLPGGYTSQGTILDDGNAAPCKRSDDKETKGQCLTHGHSSWTVCRIQRKQKLLAGNARRLRNGTACHATLAYEGLSDFDDSDSDDEDHALKRNNSYFGTAAS